MAITYASENGFTQVIFDSGSDWDSKVDFPQGLRVFRIYFFPSAANDVIGIREGSATGPLIKAKDVDGRGIMFEYVGNIIHPYIKRTDCTFSNYANVVLTIYEI